MNLQTWDTKSNQTPIELEFKSAVSSSNDHPVAIRTFNSYSFERNILTPAAAFRFTAPGVSASLRQSIRSGDTVSLFIKNLNNQKQPVGVGIIDETDTHVTPQSIEYVLSGRDLIGQLVDNAAIDTGNKITNTESISLENAFKLLIKNTRIPSSYIVNPGNKLPTAQLLFNTNPGETKISALQRYLEFTNCLVWCNSNGQAVIGKPNFVQSPSGVLISSSSNPSQNNLLEVRVKRNLNMAIRQIVTQLQSQGQVDPGAYTVNNNDPEVVARAGALVGRSVYRVFSYGDGTEAVNQIYQVGNGSGAPKTIGQALSLREIARENIAVLEVECVVRGHLNENGNLYDIDQIYNVQIDDDEVQEDMYVHHVSYELTMDHGMLTRLRLCRVGAICADSAINGAAS